MQFSDFLDQSGYTDFVESTPVPPHYVIFGYKQVVCVYTGDSKHEAEQAGATVTERVLNPEYIPYQNQKVFLPLMFEAQHHCAFDEKEYSEIQLLFLLR